MHDTPVCVARFDLRGGDLPGGHVPAPTAGACEDLCLRNANCSSYSFHVADCSDHGEVCPFAVGCCRLKGGLGDMAPEQMGGSFPNINRCSCSALVRVPRALESPPPSRRLGTPALSVLHLMADDLRPELPGVWGHPFVHAPHFANLSASGTAFRRAYCQIAVCSPSRMSFLTGRRPTTTRSFNFMDHFRHADCGIHTDDAHVSGGRVLASSAVTDHQGGSGQCCTTCTLTAGCDLWAWYDARATCTLYTGGGRIVPARGGGGGIAGRSGRMRGWVSLPQAFERAGWLTMSSGNRAQ